MFLTTNKFFVFLGLFLFFLAGRHSRVPGRGRVPPAGAPGEETEAIRFGAHA